MADIRFKISGSTSPFVAKLYKDSARDVVLQQKFVSFSGTCVTFGNLPQILTNYYIKVCDAIGNVATGITGTSGNVIGVIPLATKDISMGGESYYNPNYRSYCCIGDNNNNNNRILINPQLSSGECVDLTFTVCMENQSLPANSISMYNNVAIYCKPVGLNDYSRINFCNSYSSHETYSYMVNLKYGDDVCYRMISADNTTSQGHDITGYAWLCLSNAVGSLFNPQLLTPTCKCTNISVNV